MFWECGQFKLNLTFPKIMAVINLTADSFSDAGECLEPSNAFQAIDSAIASGADILDLGAESSRPGATPVPAALEIERLSAVLSYAVKTGLPVSVDTYKPEVMQYAIENGASIINDISGLNKEEALDIVAASRVGLCLMHMQGQPQTMQLAPSYQHVVQEVHDYLQLCRDRCIQKDIATSRIVLDPGIGFGKTVEHNLEILRNLKVFQALNQPILIGVSRKSFIGTLTGQEEPKKRVFGSIAAALYALEQGARIVRVHDVQATKDALSVWNAYNIVNK